MKAHTWYSQIGAVATAPANAETFRAKASREVTLMLTSRVSASGFLALKSSTARKYGRCSTSIKESRKNQATIMPARMANDATTSR